MEDLALLLSQNEKTNRRSVPRSCKLKRIPDIAVKKGEEVSSSVV